MPPSQASNHVYSAVALLTSFLLIIQLPVHFEPTKSRNWVFIVWVGLWLLNSSINAIIWNDNTVNWAPVWCTISSNVMIASHFGVQLSLLCIARRLYGTVTGSVVYQSTYEERRVMLLDIFISIGVPLLFLPLTYVVEAYDFAILEQIGCYPYISRTVPAILLFMIWPVIFDLVTAVYSALTMFKLLRHKAEMRKFADSENKVDNYQWRLAFLASAQIVLLLPWAMFELIRDVVSAPLVPYTWNLHANFSAVLTYSTSDWAANPEYVVAYVVFGRWIYIVYSFLFLAFFGWTERARNHYKRHYVPLFVAAMRLFGYGAKSPGSNTQEVRIDLEHHGARPARRPIFHSSFGTSFNTSRFTSSQARTTATYHTATEPIISHPRVPSPVHHTQMPVLQDNEQDRSDVGDPASLPLPGVATAATLMHVGDIDDVPAS